MRIAGLLALFIFFLIFACLPVGTVHAANPPTLVTYTISHSTIYPTATTDSGLATTTSIDTAFSEQVKVSIKIISADGSMIKSLYSSSSVTNPTPKIWDGTSTAGTQVDTGVYTVLVSATSTADNSLTMTDSSKTITVASPNSNSSDTSDDSSDTTDTTVGTVTTNSSSGGPAEYLPIPMLRIVTGGDRTISSGADTAFTAVVYDEKGNKRNDTIVTWSFGDGMRRTGASVFHVYYNSGEYLAIVRATTSDGGDITKEIIITVKDAGIKIASISPRGITLSNKDSRTLDLSLWRLSMGGKEFKIPEDTQILAGRDILLPSQVIELPIEDSAFLLYPSGEVVASYPSASGEQLSVSNKSSNTVKVVEPIISTQTNIQVHEEAVSAPAATTDYVGAAGAALSSPTLAVGAPISDIGADVGAGIFRSPWTLGLLGIIILAGGAFILL